MGNILKTYKRKYEIDFKIGDIIFYNYGDQSLYKDLSFGIILKISEESELLDVTTLDFWKNGAIEVETFLYEKLTESERLFSKK